MPNQPRRIVRFVLSVLSIATLAGHAAADQARWYIVELGGQKAGHMVSREATNEKGQLVTSEEVVFAVSRMGTKLELKMATEFVETADGKPVSMTSNQDMGIMQLNSVYRFTDDGVEEVSKQGDKETTHKMPKIEGDWLTPGKVHALVKAKLASGDSTFNYRTIDPSQGPRAYDVKTTVLNAHDTAQAAGKSVPAVRWEVESSIMPEVKNIELVDSDGFPVVSNTTIGGLELKMLLSDKETALSKFSSPEMMASTTITPSRPIQHPRDQGDILYTITATSGDPVKLPTTGSQRFTASNSLLKVTPSWPVDEHQKGMDAFLNPSKVCDSKDPLIIELTAKALPQFIPNRWDKALKLRRFVFDYIEKKSLDVGFATASEVARTKQGDCSEHAVLLAAMLRASGIGSRVASGLIFVPEFEGQKNVFVYHMWTQAYLESPGSGSLCWVDVDATLPNDKATDATHICLTTSSLADDDVLNSMVKLAELMGRLKIEVNMTDDDVAPNAQP